ncbi:MAG: type II toxin-antitoxin system prevent-host-death family antitoxin [Hormoscilla sp. GM102CHS1]|nr:type II toxin-antitoxin system prevent-host-death family antitoxin [Hormoscilla sp. GM102CHS1]
MESVMMPGCVISADTSVLRLTATEARDNLAQTVNRVVSGDRQVILSQDGFDVAAIIHIEEFWLLENLIEQLEDDFYADEADKILAQTKPEDYIPYEQVRKELGLK